MAALDRLHNVRAFAKLARRRLPRPIADYLDGGADDEWSLERNDRAANAYALLPEVLNDISALQTQTTLFGKTIAWPLMLSPTGLTRMFHDAAEPAVARSAARAGLPYALSTMGTTRIEDLPPDGLRLFQIYILKDRGLTEEWIKRARAAGYHGLILTIDTPVAGNRERDRANGLSLPPKLSLATAIEFAQHPRWSLGALSGARFNFANIAHRTDLLTGRSMSLFDYIAAQFDPTLAWDDLEWLAARWGGPLAVKGVMTPDDALRCVERGATTIMISNHGGRQLDGAPAPIEQIASVRDALGEQPEIICDGGIRRGSDIVKALALGATACSIGRPYLWGLACGGEAGVDRVLALLRAEFERTLALLGVASSAALARRHVRHVGSAAA